MKGSTGSSTNIHKCKKFVHSYIKKSRDAKKRIAAAAREKVAVHGKVPEGWVVVLPKKD